MSYSIQELDKKDWPELLKEIPQVPKKLFFAGKVPDYSQKFLCVVGSRKYSNYGKEVTEYLINGLAGFPITIVSGLALGIDSIAHRAALKNNIPTIGIPGSGLNPKVLHPQSHVQLAEEIVENGGTLISELEPVAKAANWNFPQRNRIMAGLSHAVLVVEAEIKSGTLITSRLATDYNREVLAIPGSILASTSEGPNMLLRLGATPIRNPEDILEVLNLTTPPGLNGHLPLDQGRENQNRDYSGCSLEETQIIEILKLESLPRNELMARSKLPIGKAQTVLTLLELKGLIEEKLGEMRLV